ncbi:MAG TPA: substrate-binding domain-containing protein [Solirubrobacterales bacterium]|jgi:ribose transport system substrate-binding protein|nr:substrate-binding domain-containing protein [Solirubrobacterales bacterium]
MLFGSRLRSVGLALLVLAGALAIAACGGGGSSSSSSEPSSSGSETNSSGGGGEGSSSLAAFEKKAEEAFKEGSEPQTNKPPSSGPAGQPGKTIVVIPCSMELEGCSRPADAVLEAAKAIGWHATLINPGGEPQKEAAAVEKAISIGADAISLEAVDSKPILSALEQAKKAGIYLSCFACVDGAGAYDALVPPEESLTKAGYWIGAAAYKFSNGDAKLLELTSDEAEVLALRQDGTNEFIKECEAAGGECEVVATEKFSLAEVSTKLPAITATFVRQHPDYTVLWSAFDAALPFIEQGLSQTGTQTSEQFAVGFDANEPNVNSIREGGFEKATVGLPMQWVGFAQVDQLNRLLAGQPVVDEGVEPKLLTEENVPSSGAWNGDSDVRPVYEKIWAK